MPIASMTGYARAEGSDAGLRWTWELKSVNGRNLDLRCRLPAGFEMFEPKVRAAVPERCKRGNVSVSLNLSRGEQAARVRVNPEVLDQVLALAESLRGRVDAEKPRIDGLLAIRGVVEFVEDEALGEAEQKTREAKMTKDFEQALSALAAMRAEEGARLAGVVHGQIEAIVALTKRAAAAAAAQPGALQQRLRSQVEALLGAGASVSEERLAQELAMLVTKIDVREELDRLSMHAASARQLVADGGVLGRKLDFLCQELNREANTLCSKSTDAELTTIGLDLKTVIDQLREQVQNVE